jgi:long-chain acyl-CoA synthetase
MTEISCLADIVRVHGAERPEHPALILNDQTMTWAELLMASARVAEALRLAGVEAQDRVAFVDKNGLEHFEVFFGAAMLNAVTVDVNWRLAGPEMEYIINDAEAKVLVVGPDFVGILDAIAPHLTTVTTIVVIGGHPQHRSYEDWRDSAAPVDPNVASAWEDVAFQLYSSGTTGRPKGVMLANRNFFGLLPIAKEIWELTPDSVNLVAMPLFHIAGGGWATAGMYQGCTSVILRDLDPARLVHLMVDHQITNALLVPAALQFMLMVPGIDQVEFPSLRVMVYGASPISEEVLVGSMKVFKCKFWQAYGLTETTGSVVNLAPEDHDPSGPLRHRLRSCGLPGPGVEIKVVESDTGTPVEQGAVGEIWVRSEQVMTGYWKMPEETAKVITADGWFKTGDAGYLDADGFLYIHDRVKDMIVSGGENIYPAEVENVLMGHPAVQDCAVIGIPDDKWGESPIAIVVRVPESEVTEAEIIAHCRERLAGFKCPSKVEWADMLPRNPSGKILKKDLREPYWVGRDRRVS